MATQARCETYRVSPLQTGGWAVSKSSQVGLLGTRNTKDEAVLFACLLAAQDEPSLVQVENADGSLDSEKTFGVH